MNYRTGYYVAPESAQSEAVFAARPMPKPKAAPWWLPVLVLLAAVVFVAFLSGCTPGRAYVAADRATFQAVAPEYLAYVGSDAVLSDEQKERRAQTVRSWEARLEQAESGEEGK